MYLKVMKTGNCIICLSRGNVRRKECGTCRTLYHDKCQKKFSIRCCVCKSVLPLRGRVEEYTWIPDPPDLTDAEIEENNYLLLTFELNTEFHPSDETDVV